MLHHLRGTRLAWIRSFLIVIAITMILLFVFSVWIRIKVTDEAIVSNYNSSVFMKDIMDERLNSIENLSYQIMYNDVSLKLLDASRDEDFKSSRAYNFVSDIKNFVISNNFIEDIFVYYPKYDYVLGKQGAYKSYSYYLLYHGRNGQGYEDWKNSMTNASNMTYLTKKDGNNLGLYFARYIYSEETGEKECILFCKIKKDSVNNILAWSNTQYPNKLAAITNSDNQIFAYSGDPSLLNLPLDANKVGMSTNSEKRYFYYKDYFIVKQSSKIAGLNYVLIRNRGSALAIQTSVTNILLFCFATCLLSGVALSIYMSNKNSKPLISLLSRVKTDGSETQNEYEIISGKIDQLFSENETAIQQLEQQQKIIMNSFVRAVLSSDYHDSAAVNEIIATYKINFENPYFCTALIKFSDKNNQKVPDWIYSKIEDFSEKYLRPDFDVYHSEFQKYDAFIINFQSESINDTGGISAFCSDLLEFVSLNGFQSRCVSGGVYTSSSGIGISYQEAKILLEPNTGNLLRNLKEISDLGPSNLFYNYQRLLLAKDFIGAKQALPELFQKYLTNGTAEMRLCRQNTIVNLIMEVALHQPNFEMTDRKAYFQHLLQQKSPEELEKALAQVLDYLNQMEYSKSGNTEHSKTENNDSTVYKIMNIIDNTFSNPMLCLNSISDELGVSNSYISRIFKEKYNMGVVEYINRTRIDHAKKLIAQGDISIKAIAIKVGFSSDVSFIRVFKKYEQITPGKYKQ